MESQQPDPRFKKRMPCDLRFGGHRYPGIVLNISRGGLFVQTSMGAQPGATVDVELNGANAQQPIALQARVVWKRVVSQQLRSVHQAGLGLQIHDASMSYDGLVVGIEATRPGGSSTSAQQTAPAPPSSDSHDEYRIRLGLEGSQRSRTLTIRATTEHDARAIAARKCGQHWTILELEKR
jgi:Tfp pilus assembly protein PilZ